jgi:sulfate adenylyltransferase subunit 1 (EFTu-like GTPase family)
MMDCGGEEVGGVDAADGVDGTERFGLENKRHMETTAETAHACRLLVDARNGIEPDLKTHGDYDPIIIFSLLFGDRIVIFVCDL